MDCEHARKQIHLYLDNQLTTLEVGDLEKHLNKCEECRKELVIWQKLIGAIQDGTVLESPTGFMESFIQSLPNHASRAGSYNSILFWLGQLCLVMAIFVLCWFFRGKIFHFSYSFTSLLVANFNGFWGAILNPYLWGMLLWIIIGCGATIAGILTSWILSRSIKI
jgi:hypothetical protein